MFYGQEFLSEKGCLKVSISEEVTVPLNTANTINTVLWSCFSKPSKVFLTWLKTFAYLQKVNEKEFSLDNKKWKYGCQSCREKGLTAELKNILIMLSQLWPNFSKRNLFRITKAENIVVIFAMNRA